MLLNILTSATMTFVLPVTMSPETFAAVNSAFLVRPIIVMFIIQFSTVIFGCIMRILYNDIHCLYTHCYGHIWDLEPRRHL